MLGANTTIIDKDSHPLHFRDRFAAHYGRDPQLSDTSTKEAPVVIEDDVFIGMHTIILKGATTGRGALVAAGNLVTRDVPPGAIVGGVPARIVGWVEGE